MKRRLLRKGKTLARRILDDKLAEVLPQLEVPRVLDLGSKKAPYHDLLKCQRVDSLDILIQHRPHIVGDAHCLPIRDNAYDAVIATQVLEHCHTPQQVALEAYRILKPGGVFVVSVPFIYIIHGDPYDYWRFTEYALRDILKPFREVEVWPLGNRVTSMWDFVSCHKTVLRYFNHLLPARAMSQPNRRCPQSYFALARK